MPSPDKNPPAHAELIREIRNVFSRVQRTNGISLHETEVIDRYGTPSERQKARQKDIDANWWEVRDEWIEELGGVGGLAFLDGIGLRYYLPAYLCYWLRRSKEPNGLTYCLQDTHKLPFETLFRPDERKVIAKFLKHIHRHFRDEEAKEALDTFWGRYLD